MIFFSLRVRVDFFLIVAPVIDVSDIKIEDEGDLDFQLALNKARKAKQKQAANNPSVEKVSIKLKFF